METAKDRAIRCHLYGNRKLNPRRNYYIRHTVKHLEHMISRLVTTSSYSDFRRWKVHRKIVYNSTIHYKTFRGGKFDGN